MPSIMAGSCRLINGPLLSQYHMLRVVMVFCAVTTFCFPLSPVFDPHVLGPCMVCCPFCYRIHLFTELRSLGVQLEFISFCALLLGRSLDHVCGFPVLSLSEFCSHGWWLLLGVSPWPCLPLAPLPGMASVHCLGLCSDFVGCRDSWGSAAASSGFAVLVSVGSLLG